MFVVYNSFVFNNDNSKQQQHYSAVCCIVGRRLQLIFHFRSCSEENGRYFSCRWCYLFAVRGCCRLLLLLLLRPFAGWHSSVQYTNTVQWRVRILTIKTDVLAALRLYISYIRGSSGALLISSIAQLMMIRA